MAKMSSNSTAHDSSECNCKDELHHDKNKNEHKHISGECVHDDGSKHPIHQKPGQ